MFLEALYRMVRDGCAGVVAVAGFDRRKGNVVFRMELGREMPVVIVETV